MISVSTKFNFQNKITLERRGIWNFDTLEPRLTNF